MGAASKRKRGPSASAEEAGEESKRGSVVSVRGTGLKMVGKRNAPQDK